MQHKPSKTVLFRMNGVAPGFLREYGCRSCPQCSSTKPQAHISASLLIKGTWEPRQLERHILFDCGLGAIDSLIDFGAPPVDYVFVSHGHAYHSLGLDRLVWGQRRHSKRTDPLPVYCTEETFKTGPHQVYPLFFDEKKPRLAHVPVSTGVPPAPVRIPDCGVGLKITSVQVFQGNTAPGAVIWVVEFGQADLGTYRKLVLGWEFVHFVPRFKKEDQGRHYEGAQHPDNTHLANVFGDLFKDVHELFFDGNTRSPRPTNHMSIETGLGFLIPEVRPRRTWVVHYSGHEDPEGPMSDEDLQDWVNREKKDRKYNGDSDYPLADKQIRVAKHGMVLAYEV